MLVYKRREFLAASAAVTAVGTAHAATPLSTSSMLIHHVFFWLKNPGSERDLARLLAGLRTLAQIETVRGMHFGVPADTEQRGVVERSYSASELLFFDDLQGQKAYQDHPVHKKFVADCSHLWERVVVYDSVPAP